MARNRYSDEDVLKLREIVLRLSTRSDVVSARRAVGSYFSGIAMIATLGRIGWTERKSD